MGKIRVTTSKQLYLLVFLLITGCASIVYKAINYESLYGPSAPKQRVMTPEQATLYREEHEVSFYKDIKPILDSRCVSCHGCYDAPCQLKLGSIEGLDRGATKQLVYDSTRLTAADPTRLFIDATDTEGWRKKVFIRF